MDGFAAGTWKIERSKSKAALALEPFEAIAKKAREELTPEGERLLRFAEPDAKAFEVRFAKAPGASRGK